MYPFCQDLNWMKTGFIQALYRCELISDICPTWPFSLHVCIQRQGLIWGPTLHWWCDGYLAWGSQLVMKPGSAESPSALFENFRLGFPLCDGKAICRSRACKRECCKSAAVRPGRRSCKSRLIAISVLDSVRFDVLGGRSVVFGATLYVLTNPRTAVGRRFFLRVYQSLVNIARLGYLELTPIARMGRWSSQVTVSSRSSASTRQIH